MSAVSNSQARMLTRSSPIVQEHEGTNFFLRRHERGTKQSSGQAKLASAGVASVVRHPSRPPPSPYQTPSPDRPRHRPHLHSHSHSQRAHSLFDHPSHFLQHPHPRQKQDSRHSCQADSSISKARPCRHLVRDLVVDSQVMLRIAGAVPSVYACEVVM